MSDPVEELLKFKEMTPEQAKALAEVLRGYHRDQNSVSGEKDGWPNWLTVAAIIVTVVVALLGIYAGVVMVQQGEIKEAIVRLEAGESD